MDTSFLDDAFRQRAESRHWQTLEENRANAARVRQLIEQSENEKKVIEDRQRELNEWFAASGGSIDINSFMSQFEKVSDTIHAGAVETATRSFAVIDGFVRANASLQLGLRMKDAEFDLNDLVGLQNRVTRLEAFNLILSMSSISEARREEALDRMLAKEFPTRDGIQPRSDRSVLRDAMVNEVDKLTLGDVSATCEINPAARKASAATKANGSKKAVGAKAGHGFPA